MGPPAGVLPDGIVRAISREDLVNLPIGRYDGDVRLVQTMAEMQQALEDFRQEEVVGFDTETRPSFRKGDRHLPCLIQAATARSVYLFRLQKEFDFGVLGELVASPGITKAGIGLADDMRELMRLHPFEARGMLDLGSVARNWGMEQTGLRNLAGIFLNVRILKSTKTSNWAARELSPAQVRYAATDVWVCRELFLRFRGLGMIPDASRQTAAGE